MSERKNTMKIKKMKITKTTKIISIFVVLMIVLDLFVITRVQRDHVLPGQDMQVYTSSELAMYDGTDSSKPIYLALDGYVYDISDGREDFYGPGEAYHELAGKDSSVLLQIFGGDIIRGKYQIVGVYKP